MHPAGQAWLKLFEHRKDFYISKQLILRSSYRSREPSGEQERRGLKEIIGYVKPLFLRNASWKVSLSDEVRLRYTLSGLQRFLRCDTNINKPQTKTTVDSYVMWNANLHPRPLFWFWIHIRRRRHIFTLALFFSLRNGSAIYWIWSSIAFERSLNSLQTLIASSFILPAILCDCAILFTGKHATQTKNITWNDWGCQTA